MTTTIINTIEAKEEFSDLLSRVSHQKERIILARRGKEIAAIIPIEDLHRLQSTEQQSDLSEAIEALQEVRTKGTIPFDTLNTELD